MADGNMIVSSTWKQSELSRSPASGSGESMQRKIDLSIKVAVAWRVATCDRRWDFSEEQCDVLQ